MSLMHDPELQIDGGPEVTERIGQLLATALPKSDQPLVIYLSGPLGAGKTALARAVIRSLGFDGPVRSPSYSLCVPYELATGNVLHLDLYRFESSSEIAALALDDHWIDSRLWLIEWPEQATHGLPGADLQIQIEPSGEGRRFKLLAKTHQAEQWLESFKQCFG